MQCNIVRLDKILIEFPLAFQERVAPILEQAEARFAETAALKIRSSSREIEAIGQLACKEIVPKNCEVAEREPIGRRRVAMRSDQAPAILRDSLIGDCPVDDRVLLVIPPLFVKIGRMDLKIRIAIELGPVLADEAEPRAGF